MAIEFRMEAEVKADGTVPAMFFPCSKLSALCAIRDCPFESILNIASRNTQLATY